jgi:pyruvate formate lyase activating enzyme
MRGLSRRDFICGSALLTIGAATRAYGAPDYRREARFYEKLPGKKIKCQLCPRECVIDDKERGYCGVRENSGGVYYTLVHSRPCSLGVDPIEKKPLFHFYPGTLAFSLATAGCNVNCKFCQNWEISQVRPEQVRSRNLPPGEVTMLARTYSCRSIAYTYSEPVIFYEYMSDIARAGRLEGVKSVVITNGFIRPDPLRQLCSEVDAIKVDLKGFSEKFYREVVSGELKPVLDALVTIRKQGTWLEIVYLVVPTLNDSDEELRGVCRWIKGELGPDTPMHFSRFHPEYLLKALPPTPVKTLERAKALAEAEGLRYVYIGNVPEHPAENTYCPSCRAVIVQREGFTVTRMDIKKNACPKCAAKIAGVWDS